jgi:hypothetical protein
MKKKLTILAAAAAAASMASSADAVMVLTVDDLNDMAPAVVIMDGIVPDGAPGINGLVTYSGVVGDWTVSVTGTSKPLIGSDASPEIDLGVGAAITQGPGQLFVSLSDTFPSTPNGRGVVGAIGGTSTAGSVAATIPGADPFGFSRPGGFAMATGSIPGGGVPITISAVISHERAGISSFDFGASVPDGGTTLSLLGIVLLGLAGAQRKLRKA